MVIRKRETESIQEETTKQWLTSERAHHSNVHSHEYGMGAVLEKCFSYQSHIRYRARGNRTT